MVLGADVARLVAGEAAVAAGVSLLAQPHGDAGGAHAAHGAAPDVLGHEEVVHVDVQLGPLLLELARLRHVVRDQEEPGKPRSASCLGTK